jgi:hypothetical protein
MDLTFTEYQFEQRSAEANEERPSQAEPADESSPSPH